METIILTLGLLYFLAHLFMVAFKRARVPDVLLLMLMGILIGPLGGFASPADFGKVGRVMSTIALIVILFEGGIDLGLETLRRSLGVTLKITLITFAFTALVVSAFMMLVYDLPFSAALLTGFIVGGTSSAVVIPMVNQLRMHDEPGTVLVLESALTDVLCIVMTFSMIGIARGGEVSMGRMLGSTLAALLMAALLGVAGGLVWLRILKFVRRMQNSLATIFAWVFILYGVSEMLSFNGGITALAFGVTLSNIRHMGLQRFSWFDSLTGGLTSGERSLYQEAVFVLKTFFFVYLGISIPFGDWAAFGWGMLITGAVYAARHVIVRFTVSPAISSRDASIMAIMAPKGLAAAVLAQTPLDAGVPGAEIIQNTVFMVVFISISLTALMVIAQEQAPIRAIYESLYHSFAPWKTGGAGPVSATDPAESNPTAES
ncbi:MAG: K(+)/H(+) antiporter NhaP2 [Myxococcota bacterium]|nr:K(+)/H(+) antiporter NhaP2 [Myxococcota bacterium]